MLGTILNDRVCGPNMTVEKVLGLEMDMRADDYLSKFGPSLS